MGEGELGTDVGSVSSRKRCANRYYGWSNDDECEVIYVEFRM